MSSEPRLVGRLLRAEGHVLWIDREHAIRKGDVLAASHVNGENPPLRSGTVVVAALHRDGRVHCTQPSAAIAALVADPDFGDWMYAVEPIEELRPLARSIGPTSIEIPIGQSFALTGSWRVYFNRHGAAGRPWCVAPEAGGWEVAVSSVGISTVAETVYRPKATPDDEDGRPSAWIAVDGYLTVHVSGHASIGAP